MYMKFTPLYPGTHIHACISTNTHQIYALYSIIITIYSPNLTRNLEEIVISTPALEDERKTDYNDNDTQARVSRGYITWHNAPPWGAVIPTPTQYVEPSQPYTETPWYGKPEPSPTVTLIDNGIALK